MDEALDENTYALIFHELLALSKQQLDVLLLFHHPNLGILRNKINAHPVNALT